MGLISFFVVSSLPVILFGDLWTFSAKIALLYTSSNLILLRICLVYEYVFSFIKLSCVFHVSNTDALI